MEPYEVNGMKIGKDVDCNECGGEECVQLILNSRGLWSKCKWCGFTEWEWTWGDSIHHLEYLAEKHKINLESLLSILEEYRGGLF